MPGFQAGHFNISYLCKLFIGLNTTVNYDIEHLFMRQGYFTVGLPAINLQKGEE